MCWTEQRKLRMKNAALLLCITVCSLARSSAGELHRGINVVYAVNAGDFEHTDQHGIHYESDPLHGKIGTASDYGNHLLLIGRVPEQDEILYRTERYHTDDFGYDIPLDGDGEYALILKFCEVYFTKPNMKVFDVVLNKRHTIVSELDIFHQVGRGTAHEEYAYFTVEGDRLLIRNEESIVRNGFVRLEFVKTPYDNPKINAFVLLKGNVEHIPRLSPVSDDILPMDADMAVFNDRVSAEGGGAMSAQSHQILMAKRQAQLAASMRRKEEHMKAAHGDGAENKHGFDDDDELYVANERERRTSGPKQPNPYSMDESSMMLPVFIAIGAFIPLLFCLCKL